MAAVKGSRAPELGPGRDRQSHVYNFEQVWWVLQSLLLPSQQDSQGKRVVWFPKSWLLTRTRAAQAAICVPSWCAKCARARLLPGTRARTVLREFLKTGVALGPWHLRFVSPAQISWTSSPWQRQPWCRRRSSWRWRKFSASGKSWSDGSLSSGLCECLREVAEKQKGWWRGDHPEKLTCTIYYCRPGAGIKASCTF